MKMFILLPILIAFLSSCATTHGENMNNIQIGMTKNEVIEIMGQPTSISAKGNIEFMRYSMGLSQMLSAGAMATTYVRLINKKVDSYGEVGDFDSTKTPTVRIETDSNSRSEAKSTAE
jgi:hypothetical protein